MATSFSASADGPTTGLLLVGHGTREQVGVDEFLLTAQGVAGAATDLAVEPCFLEFAAPSIADGFRRLAARGVQRVVVVPALLFSAGHAERDIPTAVASVAAEFSDIALAQSSHLGCHDSLVALSRLRFDEALVSRRDVPAHETALVLVGRGSTWPAATAEMHRFVELCGQRTPVAVARTAFVSMAEPSLEQVFDEVAASGARRIVVQPHLLFGGALVERIGQTVERYAAKRMSSEWIATRHLGPADLLVTAILDRASAVANQVAAGGAAPAIDR
jgi:sirohydrochlorin cobaltochelatase